MIGNCEYVMSDVRMPLNPLDQSISRSISPQLSLGLELSNTKDLDHFYAGPNAQAMDFVRHQMTESGESFIYLFGAIGVGKTHLLQGACHEAQRHLQSAIYVSFRELVSYPELPLEELDRFSLVCLDDVDAMAGIESWEIKLFNLFNAMQASGSRLLLAAQKPPRQLGIKLRDLESRLSWGLLFHIKPLSESDLSIAFLNQADRNGLTVGSDVIEFLLARLPRSME
ncbi:MAG: DnaA regulatory inactivator Hda, partial [Gammaproteobacteria bacterium]|nr:DnaA regulatory inactivator Hda [Gammaproteobacteria bacterium]